MGGGKREKLPGCHGSRNLSARQRVVEFRKGDHLVTEVRLGGVPRPRNLKKPGVE